SMQTPLGPMSSSQISYPTLQVGHFLSRRTDRTAGGWSGLLRHLIFCEQIVRIFRLSSGFGATGRAKNHFGLKIEFAEAPTLVVRFAHCYARGFALIARTARVLAPAI